MDKRIFALIIVIFLIVAGVVAFNYMNNSKPDNNTNITNTSSETINIIVVANQTGPATAKKGENVTINYIVSNKGNSDVFDVIVRSQGFEKKIGTLKPNETKEFQEKYRIPTDEEVKEDFGSNSMSDTFFIGGFGVSFTDLNGNKHRITSNSLEIKLL
ncbi:MAG: hypothetical protein PHY59_00200 [Methanobacterium sp.]|nr:hypothetical protein [Methanobacterium sp.]